MRYRVLGPIEVVDDEPEGRTSVAVGGPQQRRLLGVLLTYPDRVVSTDRLVEALWPDADPPSGANRSVLTYVSRLRASLGREVIVSQGNGFRLDRTAGSRDIDSFESLITEAERSLPDRAVACYDEALALWRGRPFGEFGDEWWAIAETTRLAELYASARERRVSALLKIGHHDRAIPDLEGLIVEYPLRERPVSLLVKALHSAGRTAEALRAARAFRDRLADETGLEPTAEFSGLERSIADGSADGGESAGTVPLRGYTLGEPIGEGASGRVYVGMQPGTGRRVAIKVVRPDLADSADFIRRFEAEARLVARLEHPHIVPLYDYWREPGGAYLVFRLLPGGSVLDSLVTGGAWSLNRIDRLVEDIEDALITAHGLGVHHNDVSAANVLLDDTGAAYLTDFGIATEADDGTTESAGAVRRDVRAFAWLAWELLTGPDDFGSAWPSRRLQRDRPEPLIGRMPDVPAALDAVLASATSADGTTSSVAEFVLGWRAAMGRSALDSTPVRSADESSSSRRRAAAAMARSIVAGVNPYKGLRPFDESDADIYFGRDGVAAELATLVGQHRLVTVVGPSGSGKSSLVKAGLVPLLRSSGATIASMVPGSKPTAALRDALVSISPTSLRGRDCLANLRTVARRAGRLVIVVDQFEETWTIADENDRVEFVGALVSAIGDQRLDVSVVTTIRADRFDLPLQDPTIGPEIGAGTYAIGPMSAGQVAEAILGPARRAGVDVDDTVVADLVAAAVEPGTLPMLQFTLAELYESRRDGCIGREALDAIGGMAAVIGRTTERVYAGLEPVEQRAARELLCRLVVLGDDGVATRRCATFSELWPDALTVADDFVAARMLMVDRDPASREPTVEIAHEALVRRWPRLAGWIEEDRQWLAQLHHLTASTRAWRASGYDRAELYRGARLEAALEAVDAGRLVSAEEREFLEAGRHLRDVAIVDAHRSARRLRILLAGTAVALVVALVAGSVAVIQRGRADDAATEAILQRGLADDAAAEAIAEAERADEAATSASIAEREAKIEALVGRAESIRSTQRATSALLAVEAFRMDDTANTRSALFSTFTNEHGFLDAHTIEQTYGPPGVVMPDGETAFIGGDDGRIRPYDLDSGAVGDPLPALAGDVGSYSLLRPSPDGRYLAQVANTGVGNREAIAGVFDLETGSLVFDPVRFGDAEDRGFQSATFGPDGQYLFITRTYDNELLAIDAQTGETHIALAGIAPASGDPFGYNGGGVAAASNNRIVAGTRTGVVTILDADSFEVESTLTAPPNTATTFRTAGDGALVVGDGMDGVFVLDVDNASILWEDLDYSQSCALLAVVAERSAIYCADFYGRLVERDLTTGELRRTLEGQNGHAGQLFSAHGGTELVSFAGEVPVVSRWRLDGSGPITRSIAPGWEVVGHSPDGTQLLLTRPPQASSASGVPPAKVVDVATGADVATVPARFLAATFIDEGRLDGAFVLANGTLRGASLDLASGELTTGDGDALLPGVPDIDNWEPGKQTMLVAFHSDDGTRTEIWNLSQTGPVGAPFETGRAYSMSASRDGTRVALALSAGVEIRDGRTGELLGTIDAPNVGAVFITIADQLVVATNDGGLTLYGLDDLQPIRTFPGSRGRVEDLYSTNGGSIIAARGGDRTVSIFDTATGTQLGKSIVIADGESFWISLAPDGSTLAVGGGGRRADAPVKIWNLNPATWVDAACRLAGRNLTHEEWDSYIGDLAPYAATCPEFPTRQLRGAHVRR